MYWRKCVFDMNGEFVYQAKGTLMQPNFMYEIPINRSMGLMWLLTFTT